MHESCVSDMPLCPYCDYKTKCGMSFDVYEYCYVGRTYVKWLRVLALVCVWVCIPVAVQSIHLQFPTSQGPQRASVAQGKGDMRLPAWALSLMGPVGGV